ncbi:MAG TPA: hypothetical protein VFW92_10935 [Candidatus Limnocylindrales bacterium]|jgi:hypothetical protein|nr:hypothetical protein [Candidatus Limnocylindrales bacterium]
MRQSSSAAMAVVLVVVAVGLLGCSATPGASIVAVRTRPPAPSGQQILCSVALHVPFTLVGDPTADPPDWGVTRADARRFDIVWPAGFTARFDPDLEILDPSGAVVARAGTISDAGGTGDDQTVWICGIGGKTYTH